MSSATRHCKSCGQPFAAARGSNGKLHSTCSLPCRLAALDRLIAAMTNARNALARQVAAGEADGG